MSPLLSNKRKARIVSVTASEDEGTSNPASDQAIAKEENEPLVKRPAIKGKGKSKKRTLMSFGGGTSMADDDTEEAAVVLPKSGSAFARRNSEFSRSASSTPAAVRHQMDRDQPTYDAEYLNQLKQSTRSAPTPLDDQDRNTGALDIAKGMDADSGVDVAAKFGPSAAATTSTSKALNIAAKFPISALTQYESSSMSLIPNEAEVREKKARRARLAAEQAARTGSGSDDDANAEERSHDAMDSDDEFANQHNSISFYAQGSTKAKKQPESRLVREDEREDFMEDEELAYPSAGTIQMSKVGEKARKAEERERVRSLIDAAEGQNQEEGDGSESPDSSQAERDAYEAAQTKRGLGKDVEEEWNGQTFIPHMPPLPTMSSIAEKLTKRLEKLRQDREADMKRLEEVARERKEIEEAERGVDEVLKGVQERWNELVESGMVEGNMEGEKAETRQLTMGEADNGDEVEK